jgi:hypothetical protein
MVFVKMVNVFAKRALKVQTVQLKNVQMIATKMEFVEKEYVIVIMVSSELIVAYNYVRMNAHLKEVAIMENVNVLKVGKEMIVLLKFVLILVVNMELVILILIHVTVIQAGVKKIVVKIAV